VSGSLAGQKAIVTGAASGIGRGIACALAGEGMQVAILDSAARESADAVVASIQAAGGNAFAVQADVSDEASAVAAVTGAARRMGGLDLLVSSAGVIADGPLLETPVAVFDRIMAVNVRGTFIVGREALRIMSAQGRGRVINISSELALLGREQFSPYCASKGAVLSMTRSWAREFAPNVLVNAIAPGPTDTPMLDIEHMSPEWRKKEENNPLGRIARVEEIAAVAVFLAGPGATFITGQCISPNGGAAMY
jgi:3-oxoacyl-[acyl-carrier protein] reductase